MTIVVQSSSIPTWLARRSLRSRLLAPALLITVYFLIPLIYVILLL